MKIKTPFEQAGFKATDTFKVKCISTCFDLRIEGELTLGLDDGTEIPLFHDERGERWWLHLSSIEPVKVEAGRWVEWYGGECPVEKRTLVDVRYRDGVEVEAVPAGVGDLYGSWGDIVAYRLHKSQEVEQTEDALTATKASADDGWNEAPDTEAATSFLDEAKVQMADRAKERDTEDGERSMAKTVNAFNAMFGKDLTETQGWQFMELLKMARSTGGAYRRDDFVDGAAYVALAGESASKGETK